MHQRKVLFTSPVQPFGGCSPDVYSWNKSPTRVRLIMSFLNHPGLCFLKANVPGVDVLEYPTWDEFAKALETPPEILGLSFYVNETELVLRMARYARERGVKEIWCGNYGAYSPRVAAHFDRVFTGWAERQVAEALGQPANDPDQFVHPPMYGCMGANVLPLTTLNGFLFTSRGCPYTCNYCQTPSFYGKAAVVPLQAIDRVLRHYVDQGVLTVNVLDENFGIFPAHTREVIALFKKYGIRWIPLCRVDLLLRHFDEWVDHGLFGAHLGVESLNQDSLAGANKRLDHLKSVEVLGRMAKNNLIVQAFYMIGFENDTAATIRADIGQLKNLNVDLPQVQIVTPYPQTPLSNDIDRTFGISDDDFSRYNSRNLVWRHPHLQPEELKGLQDWAHGELCSSARALRTLKKAILCNGTPQVTTRALRQMVRAGWRKALTPRLRMGIRNARRWARVGWYPYEEVTAADRLLPPESRVVATAPRLRVIG